MAREEDTTRSTCNHAHVRQESASSPTLSAFIEEATLPHMSLKKHIILATMALALATFAAPSSSTAQETNPDPAGLGALYSLSTTSAGGAYSSLVATLIASPIITMGGIAATIIAVIKNEEPVALMLYLDENRALTMEAIATGGGPGVHDLATYFAVARANESAFARLLTTHRANLLPLLANGRISGADALEFATIVTRAMMEHPDLERDVFAALSMATSAPKP